MNKILIIGYVLLFISVIINGFLMWYIRTTLKKLLFISENFSFLKKAIQIFSKHLKGIYQLETYYGDETIKFLFEHSRELLKIIKDFDDIIALSEEQELILDDQEIEIDVGNTDDEEEEASIENAKKEFILYGGTRKGNS